MDRTHDQYLRRLADYDDPVLAEHPNRFDHQEAKSEFTRFAASILSEFEEAAIKMGMRIQDTSFHRQIILANFPIQGDKVCVIGDPLFIRASNFGKFITAFRADRDSAAFERLPPSEAELLRILVPIEQWRYTYIPVKVLNEPYAGGNPRITRRATWFRRYFDYIY